MAGDFFERVYVYLQKVPRGKVVTYGQIARALGAEGEVLQGGDALHVHPMPGVVPLHRGV